MVTLDCAEAVAAKSAAIADNENLAFMKNLLEVLVAGIEQVRL
jgi:hypothetical protein